MNNGLVVVGWLIGLIDGIVCGVEGSDCRPFYSREWRPFRCMDRCAWKDNTTGLDV